MVTMTTARGFSCGSPTGPMTTRCSSAPIRNPPTMPPSIASHRGTPAFQKVHTMNVENMASSPWAKFNRPVAR